ncbi:hypothetical protein [Myxococcus virescens]|uniref:Uncharacterized protein n=1 Tax=Myxococcus virescens TaxID=83456 RepID=A0ABY0MJD9_9BACT|nr:hypothetical protein [Myxococcus virescens]SDD65468.1 hypothetical protein SAMN04488504_102142 [Myxococcus virescens]
MDVPFIHFSLGIHAKDPEEAALSFRLEVIGAGHPEGDIIVTDPRGTRFRFTWGMVMVLK